MITSAELNDIWTQRTSVSDKIYVCEDGFLYRGVTGGSLIRIIGGNLDDYKKQKSEEDSSVFKDINKKIIDNNIALKTIEEKVSTNDKAALISVEPLSGIINGSNNIFTTSKNFNVDKVVVYVNGLRQKIVTDYQLSNNNTVTFTFSPIAGEILTINY